MGGAPGLHTQLEFDECLWNGIQTGKRIRLCPVHRFWSNSAGQGPCLWGPDGYPSSLLWLQPGAEGAGWTQAFGSGPAQGPARQGFSPGNSPLCLSYGAPVPL